MPFDKKGGIFSNPPFFAVFFLRAGVFGLLRIAGYFLRAEKVLLFCVDLQCSRVEGGDVFLPRAAVFEFDFVRAFLRNDEVKFFDSARAAEVWRGVVGDIILGEHIYAARDGYVPAVACRRVGFQHYRKLFGGVSGNLGAVFRKLEASRIFRATTTRKQSCRGQHRKYFCHTFI